MKYRCPACKLVFEIAKLGPRVQTFCPLCKEAATEYTPEVEFWMTKWPPIVDLLKELAAKSNMPLEEFIFKNTHAGVTFCPICQRRHIFGQCPPRDLK